VFWSQVLEKNRKQGCYEPGAKENKLFRQKPKTKEIFKGGSRNKIKVLPKKNLIIIMQQKYKEKHYKFQENPKPWRVP
jgi:hypothetical protein